MKLLLLQPPVQDFYDTEIRLQPLGLCQLKSAVNRFVPGVDAVVADYHHGCGRRTVTLPRELSYLRELYPCPDQSPFSSFHGYYHFGATFDALAEGVARQRPDLVGISSMFSAYHREVLRCAAAIKRRVGVPIIVGGAHPTAAPLSLLADPAVDFVIRGEGERPLVEFLRVWREGGDPTRVPNLAFKHAGRPVFTPEEENYSIHELPRPDFSDFPLERYRIGKRPLATLQASRGCPNGCSFCSAGAVFGRRYRRRTVEDLLDEIRERFELGYRAFDFEDDHLTLPAEEMKKLCQGITAVFAGERPALCAMNGVSYANLSPELLGLMRQAGFSDLNLSLVSADPEVSRGVGRPFSMRRYVDIVRAAFQLGFRVVSYQILGLPGDSLESMIHTLALAARLPVLIGASPFYLPPGAPMARDLPDRTVGELVKCRLTAMGAGVASAPPEEIYTLFVSARILNFLKGLRLRETSSLGDAIEAAARTGGRWAVGADLLTRLLEQGRLFAATRAGPEPLPRFRFELFQKLWSSLGWVTTLAGGRIQTG